MANPALIMTVQPGNIYLRDMFVIDQRCAQQPEEQTLQTFKGNVRI